jgi:uncharacterized membrane protein YeaQ/YmgE (transglycosylase-associated protein family)
MAGHGIIYTIVIGFIVGVVAKLLMPGRDPSGFIWTVLIGIAGSWIAQYLGQTMFHWYGEGSAPGFIASVIGAMILLLIYHLIRRNSNP